MLKQRILTALIALPLAIALLVYAPKSVMLIFFLVLVALGTYEAASMMFPKLEAVFSQSERLSSPKWLVLLAVFLACLMFFASASAGVVGQGLGVVVGIMLASLLIAAFIAESNESAIAHASGLLVSMTYGAFPWLASWGLYEMGPGSRYLLLLCTVVWAGDTGAYFAGRAWGKHKLAPRMSPKKTWEGSIAGLLASLTGASLANLVYGGELASWPVIALVGVLGGAFGQMGDLVESTIKRFSGVKDSGVIFPGHGGFLDRVDGLLFAAPVVWALLYYFS